MKPPIGPVRLAPLLLAMAASSPVPARDPPAHPDSRNFAHGSLIPDEDYCDQPRIVVTRNGTWVCVLTTGPGREGGPGQHVVAASSTDQGASWSALADVEPADRRRKSSYALALCTPADRVYAFYCYNGDGISTLPDGTSIRDDMQGWLCFRYSDNCGTSWSERRRVPLRVTKADRRNNWSGQLQMFWAVGTPTRFNQTALFAFTKLGRYLLQEGEGWFVQSDNLLTEPDPDRLHWELLPDGDQGLRRPEFGSVQEEHDVVALEEDDLFCVYRTTLGHAACSYSRDGGHSWSIPQALAYQPGGRIVKQPRACAKVWKTAQNRYLLWFHNNSTTTFNSGPNAGSRNLAWLSAGRLIDGFLHWSQPDIVAYVDGSLEGCSYPDLVEDNGRFFFCATQKSEARVFELDQGLLQDLLRQHTLDTIATNALALDLQGQECAHARSAPVPKLDPLSGPIQGRTLPTSGRGGLTLDLGLRLDRFAPGQIILDTRNPAGQGWTLRTAEQENLRLELSDGWTAAFWESDAHSLRTGTDHQVAVVIDGGPKVLCFIIDGWLCDGGARRPFGYGRFPATLRQVRGSGTLQIAPDLSGRLSHLRLYTRALRISEVVGNHRAAALPRPLD